MFYLSLLITEDDNAQAYVLRFSPTSPREKLVKPGECDRSQHSHQFCCDNAVLKHTPLQTVFPTVSRVSVVKKFVKSLVNLQNICNLCPYKDVKCKQFHITISVFTVWLHPPSDWSRLSLNVIHPQELQIRKRRSRVHRPAAAS